MHTAPNFVCASLLAQKRTYLSLLARGGRACHSTLASAVIGCHSLGIYRLILLPLRSYSAKMTLSSRATANRSCAAARTPSWYASCRRARPLPSGTRNRRCFKATLSRLDYKAGGQVVVDTTALSRLSAPRPFIHSRHTQPDVLWETRRPVDRPRRART